MSIFIMIAQWFGHLLSTLGMFVDGVLNWFLWLFSIWLTYMLHVPAPVFILWLCAVTVVVVGTVVEMCTSEEEQSC